MKKQDIRAVLMVVGAVLWVTAMYAGWLQFEPAWRPLLPLLTGTAIVSYIVARVSERR